MTARRGRRALQVAAGLAVSAGLLYWALRGVDPNEVLSALSHADWRVFAGALFSWGAAWWFRAERWRWLLAGPRPRWRSCWDANVIGFFVTMLVPLRFGEVVRAWVLSRDEGRSFAEAAASLVLERVFDMAFVLLFFAASLFFVPADRIPPEVTKGLHLSGAALLLAVAALPLAVAGGPRLVRRFAPRWEWAARFFEALGAVRGRRLAWVAFHSFWVWAFGGGAVWFAAHAFAVDGVSIGAKIGLPGAFFVLGVTCLAIALPSAPGFIGTYHAGAALALFVFGYDRQEVAAFAIASHLANFGLTILLGLEALARRGFSLDIVPGKE